jgi:hypothetical protein
MDPTATKRLRLSLALLIGLPGTVVFLPLAAFIGYAGIDVIIDALRGGPWNYSPAPTVQAGLLSTGWGAAGIVGLVGFWIWVWQPTWSGTPRGRLLVAALVATGMGAIAPLATALLTAPLQASLWSALSGMGLAAGTIVLYTQLRHFFGTA